MTEVKITREKLKEIEWSASSYPEDSRCPVCHNFPPDSLLSSEYTPGGHAPECWLGKAVAGK